MAVETIPSVTGISAETSLFDWKQSCRVATTANITLSGEQTIDGVSVVAGNRVLVKDQSTASQNGIYVCSSAAWSRATDADSDAEVTSGLITFIEEGTANADEAWLLITNNPITLGTTNLTFSQTTLGSGTDHGSLTGLSDDDHTQYALLAGRSGGQTLIGGTAASNNLTLQSTANATRGTVSVSDPFLLTDQSGAASVAGRLQRNGTDISFHDGTAARNVTFDTNTQTLTNKTLTTPVIGSFTNATHNHQAAAGGGTLDHGLALTGLTDDDHTQYVLLAGRSGGQSLIGGTAASNTLTLTGTSHGTPGDIILASAMRWPTVSKTANYTATAADMVIRCDASGGAFTITLPAAASIGGRVYIVQKVDTGTNAVTIDPNAAETIEGASTYVLYRQNQSLFFVSDGTNWHSIANSQEIACQAVRTTVQSIANATATVIAYNATDAFDTHAMHDPASNNSRITIRAPGAYAFFATFSFAVNGTGSRLFGFMKNGAADYIAYEAKAANATFNTYSYLTAVGNMAANDYVEVEVYQDSGGALDIDSVNEPGCTFTAIKLRD